MEKARIQLTLLSLSFGGSWGSMGLGGGEGAFAAGSGADAGALLLSLVEEVFAVGVCAFSLSFSAEMGVSGTAFSGEADCVTASADFEMTAILVPGSTVSPSLATNY